MIQNKISRRLFLSYCGFSVAALGTGSCASAENVSGNKAAKPNIVFFIADDMFPEMFNCLDEGRGKNLTPNIDRLVSEGVVMMGQHVVSPVCTPSRYNCLTGRYASRAVNSGFLYTTKKAGGQTVIEWNTFITDKDVTLPKLLQSGGYTTGMVGKNHVVEVSGLKHFPDYHANAKDPKIVAKLKENSKKVKNQIRKAGFDYVENIYNNNPNFIGLGELAVQNLDWTTKGGLDFIDANASDPFFLYFATTVPHGPTEADRSWNADPLKTEEGYLDEPLNVLPPRKSIPRRLKKAGLAGKNKENLLWLDDSLGALIKKLEQHNLMDNTLIVFFNDHGQNAKGTVYQGGVYNPSIVWKKGGFKCGSVSKAQISNVDFAPTILDYAGVDYSDVDFDGMSFKPVLDGKTDKARNSLYFELGYARGILKGKWKYLAVRYPEHLENMSPAERQRVLDEYNADRKRRGVEMVNTDPSKPFSHLSAIPGGGHAEYNSTGKYPGYYDRDQLYDLSKDPGEQNNLAGNAKYKKELAKMKKELKKYLDDLPGTFSLDNK